MGHVRRTTNSGTILETQVEIVQLDEDTGEFVSKGSFNHPYPTTKIMWIPDKTGAQVWRRARTRAQ